MATQKKEKNDLFDPSMAGPKLKSRLLDLLYKLPPEGRSGLTTQEAFFADAFRDFLNKMGVAATLQHAMDPSALEERLNALKILRIAGQDTVTNAYTELFRTGAADEDTFTGFTSLLVELETRTGQVSEAKTAQTESVEQAVPAASPKPKKRADDGSMTPAYRARQEENDLLLLRLEEFGIDKNALKYLRGQLSSSSKITGVAKTAFELCEKAVADNLVTKETMAAEINYAPSYLTLSRKRAEKVIAKLQSALEEEIEIQAGENVTGSPVKVGEEAAGLLERLKQFGLDDRAMDYIKKFVSGGDEGGRMGTAANALRVIENAVSKGVVEKEAIIEALNAAPSVFILGKKRALECISKVSGRKVGEDLARGIGMMSKKERKKENKRIMERMKELGLDKDALAHITRALAGTDTCYSRTGVVAHSLAALEGALEDGRVTEAEVVEALSSSPSSFCNGPKKMEELLDRIVRLRKGSKRSTPAKEKKETKKTVEKQPIPEEKSTKTTKKEEIPLSREGLARAMRMVGLELTVDLETATREELLDTVLRILSALPAPVRGKKNDVEAFVRRYTKPGSEGGQGDHPERHLKHLAALLNRFGPMRTANILSETVSVIREKKKLLDHIQKLGHYMKKEETLEPLRAKLGDMGFDAEFITRVVDHIRVSTIGMPMLQKRLEMLGAEFGPEGARTALIKRPKILVYPNQQFERTVKSLRAEFQKEQPAPVVE